MAFKRPAPKGLKLMHGFTPLIGPEAWLSTMSKMRDVLRIDIRLLPIATSAYLPFTIVCNDSGYLSGIRSND